MGEARALKGYRNFLYGDADASSAVAAEWYSALPGCSRGVVLCGIRLAPSVGRRDTGWRATVCRLPVCTYSLRGGDVGRCGAGQRVAAEWYSALPGCSRGVVLCGIRLATSVGRRDAGWFATVCRLPVCTYSLRGGDVGRSGAHPPVAAEWYSAESGRQRRLAVATPVGVPPCADCQSAPTRYAEATSADAQRHCAEAVRGRGRRP